MVELVTSQDVRDRLGISSLAEVDSAINSSIRGATLRIQSMLNTDLSYGSHSDLFFIDPQGDLELGGSFILRLSNGFVKNDSDLSVKAYLDPSAVQADQGYSVDGYVLREEKGFVAIPNEFWGYGIHRRSLAYSAQNGYYARVSYNSGLQDFDDATPDWLVEAIITYSIQLLSSTQLFDGKPELTKVIPFLKGHGSDILDGHLRVNSASIQPVM